MSAQVIAHACVQAMHAVRELQRNIAAEAAVVSEVGSTYCAVVTPFQSVVADVAAWPHNIYLLRLMRYLGADLSVPLIVRCQTLVCCSVSNISTPAFNAALGGANDPFNSSNISLDRGALSLLRELDVISAP